MDQGLEAMYSTLMASISTGSNVHPWDMFSPTASPVLPRQAPVFTLTKVSVPSSPMSPSPVPSARRSNAWPDVKRVYAHCMPESALCNDGSGSCRAYGESVRDSTPDDSGAGVYGPSKRVAVPAADGSGYMPYWSLSNPPSSAPISVEVPPTSAQAFGPPLSFMYTQPPAQNSASPSHPSCRMEHMTNTQGYAMVPVQSYAPAGSLGLYSRVEGQSSAWHGSPAPQGHPPSIPTYVVMPSDARMSQMGVAQALAGMSGCGGSPGVGKSSKIIADAPGTPVPAERKPRGPRKPKKPKRIMKTAYNCRQCGQLKKGHKCPNPDV